MASLAGAARLIFGLSPDLRGVQSLAEHALLTGKQRDISQSPEAKRRVRGDVN
jgi:hypothetical protein